MILLCIYPQVYNFHYYRYSDVLVFTLSGVLNIASNGLRSYALKLEEASKVIAYLYVDAVLVFVVDILGFGYEFGVQGIIG